MTISIWLQLIPVDVDGTVDVMFSCISNETLTYTCFHMYTCPCVVGGFHQELRERLTVRQQVVSTWHSAAGEVRHRQLRSKPVVAEVESKYYILFLAFCVIKETGS